MLGAKGTREAGEMRARVGDHELYYEVSGEGPPVVLGHSIGMNAELWRPVAERLSDAYTVVRFDARGHGRSDKPPGPYTVEAMAEDVYGLLGALGIERAVIGGLSLGGALAQALVLAHPACARALILANTAACFDVEGSGRWEARAREIERDGFPRAAAEQQVERWVTPAFQQAEPARTRQLVEIQTANDRTGIAGAARALGAVDLRPRLGEIRCPTLVITGDEDVSTTPAVARELQVAIPGAELVEIAPARHLSAWEQPDAVAAAMRAFLARLPHGDR